MQKPILSRHVMLLCDVK